MGNATKIALVALLLLLVVVIARLVRDGSEVDPEAGTPTASAQPEAGAKPASQPGTASRAAPRPGVPAGPGASSGSGAAPGRTPGEARLSGNVPGRPPGSVASSSAANAPAPSVGASVAGAPGARTPPSSSSPPLPRPVLSPESRFVSLSDLPRSDIARGDEAPGRPPDGTSSAGAPGSRGPLPVETELATAEAPPSSTDGAGRVPPAVSPERATSSPGSAAEFAATQSSASRLRDGPLPAPPGGTALPGGARPPGRTIPGSEAARGDLARTTTAAGPREYEIRPNDSYWSIAQAHYGDGSLWPAIEKHNPTVKMQPGRKLVIPPKPERAAAEPAVVPARPADGIVGNGPGYRLYLVEKGDTLSGLAERFYQSSATDKQALIEDANPHLKYGYLRAGERIKIMDPRR